MLDFAFPFAGAADCDARVEPRNQDTALREALASSMMKEGLGSDMKPRLLEGSAFVFGDSPILSFHNRDPPNFFFSSLGSPRFLLLRLSAQWCWDEVMATQRQKVESCVVDIISTLREAKITVEDFRGEESQATLFRLMYGFLYLLVSYFR